MTAMCGSCEDAGRERGGWDGPPTPSPALGRSVHGAALRTPCCLRVGAGGNGSSNIFSNDPVLMGAGRGEHRFLWEGF